MSNKTVDERTMKMNFDNSNFEANVTQTMSTLDRLKSALRLKGVSSGLNTVSNSVNKINFDGAEKGAHLFTKSLTSLGATAKRVLYEDMVRYLENLATKFATSITTQPLKDGLAEYENQINSVQTIMANTGSDVKSVNAVLDELNTYADKTIYNFGQMTKNMGTFTAAMGNGSLEDAANSIKGIGNWAAYAGTNAEDMARATYQLSQALSTGAIKLQDWRSIENTGGMAGQNFQEQFKETAREFGIDVDSMIEKNGNFRESLKEGWLTTDVFLATMKKFAENEAMTDAATKVKTFSQFIDTAKEALGSGWAQVFRTIIGDFEQAKAFWTKASDTIGGVINKFFEIVQKITDRVFTSKWEQLEKTLDKMGISMDVFKSALAAVVKSDTGKSLSAIIKECGSLEKVITSGAISSKQLKKALLSIATTALTGSKSIKKGTKTLKEFSKMADRVINGDFGNGEVRVKKLTEAGWDYQKVQDIVNKKIYGQKIALDDLTGSQEATAKLTKEQREEYQKLVDALNDPSSDISKLLDQMTLPSGRELLIDTIANAWHTLATVAGTIKDAFNVVFDKFDAAQKLYDKLWDIAKKSKEISDTVAAKTPQLTSIFSGLFSIIKFGIDVIGQLKEVLGYLLSPLDGLGGGLVDLTASLGDTITEFVKWYEESGKMEEITETTKKGISDMIDGIKEYIDKMKELDGVQEATNKFAEAWGFLSDKFKEFVDLVTKSNWYQTLSQQITDFFHNLPDTFLKTIEAIAKFFVDLFDGTLDFSKVDFKGFFKGFTEGMFATFEGFYDNGIKGLREKVKEFASDIYNALGLGFGDATAKASGLHALKEGTEDIIDTLKNTLGSIDLEKFAGWAMSGGFLAILYKMSKSMIIFAKAAENFSQIGIGIGKFMTSLSAVPNAIATAITTFTTQVNIVIEQFGETLRGVRWKLYGEAIKKFAEAIGILVIALGGLTLLTHYGGDDFWKAVVALEILVIDMIALMAVLDKLAKSTAALPGQTASLGTIAAALLGLSIALAILTSAATKLGKLDIGSFAQGMLGLGLMVGAFIGLLAVLGKMPTLETAKIASIGNTALKLSAAMAIIAVVIKMCGSITAEEGLKAIGVASAFLIFMGLLSLVTKKYSLVGSDLGTTMLKLSVAMGILVMVTKQAADMSDKDMIQMAKFAAGFVVFVGMLALVTRNAKTASGLGGMLVGVGVAIYLMTMAVQSLGQMNMGQLVKGMACVVVFGLIIKKLIDATDIIRGGSFGLGATLVGAGIAIAAMAAIAIVLGMIPIENLAKGVVAVSILGLVMAQLIKSVGTVTPAAMAKITTILVAVGIALALIAAVTFILSNAADPAAIAAAGFAIAAVTAAMSLFMYCTKFVTISGKALGGIAAALVCVAAIGVLLAFLSNGTDPAGALSIAVGISAVLLAMSAALAVMGTFGNGVGPMAMAGMVVLAGVVAILGFVLHQMDSVNPEGVITKALALSALIVALSASMVLLGVAGAGGPAALIGAATLLVFILACALLAAGIGWLNEQCPAIGEYISKGGPLLIKMAELTGRVIGAFLGGALGQLAASSLVALGEGLSDFMESIQPFIARCKELNADDFKGVGPLALAILEIVGADFISKIASFLGLGNLSSFTEQLAELGEALKVFSSKVRGGQVDPKAITVASQAAKNLGEFLDNAPREGTLHDFFVGKINWESLNKGIGDFGKAMKKFGDTFSGDDAADIEAIKTATKAGILIGKMSDSLPRDHGAFNIFFGEIKWGDLSTGIKKFGGAMKSFSEYFSGDNAVSLDSIKTATKAGVLVGKMTNELPEDHGILNAFFGEINWEKLCPGITGFGKALTAFGTEFANAKIDLTVFDSATKAGTKLAEMVSSMNEKVGTTVFDDWFGGTFSWEDVSKGIKQFGDAVGSFGTSTANIDLSAIDSAIKAADKIVTFAYGSEKLTKDSWLINGEINFNTLKTNLNTLASSMNTFALITSTTTPESLEAGISGLRMILQMGKSGMFTNNVLASGEVDFSLIKQNIISLASAMNQLSILSGNIDYNTLSVAQVGVEALGAIGQSISANAQYFTVSTIAFPTFTQSIAKGLMYFFDETAGISLGSVMNACNCVRAILKVAQEIGSTTSGPIVEFINGLENINKDAIDRYINVFKDKSPDVKKAAADLIKASIEGAKSKENDYKNTIKNMLKEIIKIMADNAPNAKKPGTDTAAKFLEGLNSKKGDITQASKGLCTSATNAMSGGYNSAWNAGANIGRGLYNGLLWWQQGVYNAARNLANAATNAIRQAQQIHSPSKVQFKNGQYIGLGLINGMLSTFSALANVGTQASDLINGSISEALHSTANYFNDDIESRPVIRPVVDLTDIEKGKDAINGLSTLTPTLGVSANIQSLGGIRRNGIYSNSDVVEAVNGLATRIDGIQPNTTNYNVNGVTYDDGSNVSTAVGDMIRAIRIERRV